MLGLILFLVGLALVFDFFNGFHDAANSVATVVTTRVLSPLTAVLWAAFFNFVAAFLFGTGVAETISKKLVDPQAVDVYVICGALLGAIAWDILTWLMALPTSSSHALVAGFAGAAVAKAGFGAILLKGWMPVFAFLILSPLIGMVLGWTIMTVVGWLSFRTERHTAERRFRHLQLFSAGAYSLGHGTNDAQKTMGIIAALLAAGGHKDWTAGHGTTIFGEKHELAWWDRSGDPCQSAHFHYARHRRLGRRGGSYPWGARGAVAMGRKNRLGLGADLPRCGPHRCQRLPARPLGHRTMDRRRWLNPRGWSASQ